MDEVLIWKVRPRGARPWGKKERRRHGIHGDGSGIMATWAIQSLLISMEMMSFESDLQCLLECKYGRWNGS